MYNIGVGIWYTEKQNLYRVKFKQNENWILKKAPPKFDVGHKKNFLFSSNFGS
jgi:hypothetical protein